MSIADQITPNQTMTFTVQRAPRTTASRKTIERLMGMQTSIQSGRNKLANQRRLKDNVTYIRAGRKWVNRKRATKLAIAEPGATFTLLVTPQIVNDLKSVADCLEVA
ncbi:MAG: hypothetical protein CMJ41_07080 [Phycisphaerae bacterium]|nr:hypothetical protein [Phycisphaerae bacterium]|tara:strand:- start:338 stop:658 length:321 start_codon:yes stop_codon:yes gene_type:complete